MEVIVIDNFLMRPDLERHKALSQKYLDIEHNGLKYRGIAKTTDHRNLSRIEKLLGVKFKESTVFYRRNLENETNETYIHSDILIGTFTCILFLNPHPPPNHGTAFWRHKIHGFDSHVPSPERDQAFWDQIYKDGFDEEKWDMTQLVPMKYNRLLIFHSPRYHSRFPKQAFGTTLEDARLVKVFFGKV